MHSETMTLNLLALLRTSLASLAALTLTVLLSGCGGGASGSGTSSSGARAGGGPRSPAYVDELRKGDMVEVKFSGTPQPPSDTSERIKEDGTINLPLIGAVVAEGKTDAQLQNEIQQKYVPHYFRRLTVVVRSENRVFFVDGEVRRPDRYVYTGEITVMKAVAAAGGFTDFAARRRIELVRSTGEKLIVDASDIKDRPELDLPVIPGDRIYVPRRSPFGR